MSPLSVLHLAILPDRNEIYIQFLVDGENLGEMVRRNAGEHSSFFFGDILPYHGGDYQPEATVLGRPARTRGLSGAILFACGCGQIACSCVLVDVSLTDTTIIFQNFRVRGGRTSSLAPITFTRGDYEAAITELERQVANWKPPPPSPPKPPMFLGGNSDPEPEIHPEQEC